MRISKFPFRVARSLAGALALAFSLSGADPPADGANGPVDGARRIMLQSMDEIHQVKTGVRRVTLIELPSDESLAQAWTGDADYWSVRGAGRHVYLKPAKPDLRTNLTLATESGRNYLFVLVSVGPDDEAEVAVKVSRADEFDAYGRIPPRDGFELPDMRYVPAAEVAEFRDLARAARESEADLRASIPRQIEQATDAVRRDNVASMNFDYDLQNILRDPPFNVDSMWNDGRLTYIATDAVSSPALFAVDEEGKPLRVDYTLTEDGVLMVPEVLGDGYLQIGKKRGRWMRKTPAPEAR